MTPEEILSLKPGEKVYYMANKGWAERAYPEVDETSIELLVDEAYFGIQVTEGPNVGLHLYLTNNDGKLYDASFNEWDSIEGLMCEHLYEAGVLFPEQLKGLKISGQFRGPELIGLRTYVDPNKEED